eukprot:gnl/Dysnectes_brevis/2140_a2488_972.p1 GENE.gnl/Dysnectes_brevis/2140_a2488_972~~gnl/Dysnectes_brevis/2140_a2488_972.p1  ORF type:complete len:346 (+),score=110.45 gnl/Dysnectes_brevis/2140_a2488_972:50-1087(+)
MIIVKIDDDQDMHIAIIYSTSTGNTKYCSEIIKSTLEESELDCTVSLHDSTALFKSLKSESPQDTAYPTADAFIFGSWTISFRPPVAMMDYIASFPALHITGKPFATFAMCAGSAGKVNTLLSKPMVEKGGIFVGCEWFRGPSNWMPGRYHNHKQGVTSTWPLKYIDRIYTWASSLPGVIGTSEPVPLRPPFSLLPTFPKSMMQKSVGAIQCDEARCTSCQACVRACPFDCLRLEGGRVVYTKDECEGCASCIQACRFGALGMKDFKFQDAPRYRFSPSLIVPDDRVHERKERLQEEMEERGVPEPRLMDLNAARRKEKAITVVIRCVLLLVVVFILWLISRLFV